METSHADRAIFNRIRNAQKRPAETIQAERDAVRDYLRRHPQGPRPDSGANVVQRFMQQALWMFDTIAEVTTLQDVPAAVAVYLDSIGVAKNVIAWTTLNGLPWREAELQTEFRPPRNEDLVGITGGFCAVAETGALMLLSRPEIFASASLLPKTHVAIVASSRIVAGIDDAFALARNECGELPRATNLISGPSRTGHIKQTIMLGAH